MIRCLALALRSCVKRLLLKSKVSILIALGLLLHGCRVRHPPQRHITFLREVHEDVLRALHLLAALLIVSFV